MDDLQKLLEKKIRPKAEKMDFDVKALRKAFKILGRRKLLAQRAPKEYGGKEIDQEGYFAYTELLQSYSGALGFLQRQHQAAVRFMANSDKESLKKLWLPLMAKGKRKVGVSVSHLRFPDELCVEGVKVEGGYSLRGHVSWVSGYRIFDWVIMGFIAGDQEVMAIIPFKKSYRFKPSPVLKTVALSSTQTVSIDLKGVFVSDENTISSQPIGTFAKSKTALNVQFVNLSAVVLGFLREVDVPEWQLVYEECREAFLEKGADINLYAEMNRIATNLSYIARFTHGNDAIICPNWIERRSRELILFSTLLSSEDIAKGCLQKLLD